MKPNSKKKYWILLIILVIVLMVFILKTNQKEKISPCIDCNIIFIDIDTLRADHLGIYGYYRNISPNIDNFAKKSILFKKVYSQAHYTEMSVKSLLTSSLPWFWKNKINKNITLPQILKKQGYFTILLSGNFTLELTQSSFDLHFIRTPPDSDDGIFNYSLEWIMKNKNKKFFLYIHGNDVHNYGLGPNKRYKGYFGANYTQSIEDILKNYSDAMLSGHKNLHENDNLKNFNFVDLRNSLLKQEQINQIIDSYDGGVLDTDELFGSFIYEFNKTGLLNKTIIVVFSNHGEDLLENGRVSHYAPSYATLSVPLMVYVPEADSKSIEAPVALIDIMPTILSLVNITINHTILGVDLVPLIENPKLAYKSRIIPGYQYIIEGDWMLPTHPQTQLYNLKYDRNESNNLADTHQDITKRLLNEYSNSIIKSAIDND